MKINLPTKKFIIDVFFADVLAQLAPMPIVTIGQCNPRKMQVDITKRTDASTSQRAQL